MAGKKKNIQFDKETIVIAGIVLLVLLWTVNRIFSNNESKEAIIDSTKVEGSKETNQIYVPLATGKESIDKIFIQAGCAACHTIPGIKVARGREGPKLELGTNAQKRLKDPNYKGQANTEWEYVQESILNPGLYIVKGYRDHVMPRWYGQRLSAEALDKIIKYLLKIEEVK